MTRAERLVILEKFNEGSEIGDVVSSLLQSAEMALGINMLCVCDMAIVAAEQAIREHFHFLDETDYHRINADVYRLVMDEEKPEFKW